MSSSSNWRSNVLCRFYKQGMCTKDDQCQFSHQLDAFAPSMVCHFYQLGKCTHGQSCRYDHVKGSQHQPGFPKNSLKPAQLTNSRSNTGKMTTLKKNLDNSDSGVGEEGDSESVVESLSYVPKTYDPESWTTANEFVPGKNWQSKVAPCLSYVGAAQSGIDPGGTGDELLSDTATAPLPYPTYDPTVLPPPQTLQHPEEICPYNIQEDGMCPYKERCQYRHAEMCEYCGQHILHPTDTVQREKHTSECMKLVEEDMKLSFAIQGSSDKQCGICLETVVEKKPEHLARFGILSCSHCFCLTCIRQWRSTKTCKSSTVRACPECRSLSNFVTPSKFWVEEEKEKEELVENYKQAMSKVPCKYFKQGKGECPFNGSCFYKHAYPDGRPASPRPMVRRRKRYGANNTTDDSFDSEEESDIFLSDFLVDRINWSLQLEPNDLWRMIRDSDGDSDDNILLYHQLNFNHSDDDSDFLDWQ